MAKSTKPRKTKKNVRVLQSIEFVKSMLSDTLIGSIQMGKNISLTKKNGIIYGKPSQGVNNALVHIKFRFKFMLGVISRLPNSIPKLTIQFVTFNTHSKLYDSELSDLVFTELKRMFDTVDTNHRLTTFWIASPNELLSDSEFFTFMFQLLDHYQVYDKFISQYEIDNKIEPNSSLHNTTYWYGITEIEEIEWE